jgi:hypothetical protein
MYTLGKLINVLSWTEQLLTERQETIADIFECLLVYGAVQTSQRAEHTLLTVCTPHREMYLNPMSRSLRPELRTLSTGTVSGRRGT